MCEMFVSVRLPGLVILDVIFLCSHLLGCWGNALAYLIMLQSYLFVGWVFLLFFFFFLQWYKMSLACFYNQIDFACGCPEADEL